MNIYTITYFTQYIFSSLTSFVKKKQKTKSKKKKNKKNCFNLKVGSNRFWLLLTYPLQKRQCCNQSDGRTVAGFCTMFQGGEGEEPDCSAIVLRMYSFIFLRINVTTFKHQRTFFPQVTVKAATKEKTSKWGWIFLTSIVCTINIQHQWLLWWDPSASGASKEFYGPFGEACDQMFLQQGLLSVTFSVLELFRDTALMEAWIKSLLWVFFWISAGKHK